MFVDGLLCRKVADDGVEQSLMNTEMSSGEMHLQKGLSSAIFPNCENVRPWFFPKAQNNPCEWKNGELEPEESAHRHFPSRMPFNAVQPFFPSSPAVHYHHRHLSTSSR